MYVCVRYRVCVCVCVHYRVCVCMSVYVIRYICVCYRACVCMSVYVIGYVCMYVYVMVYVCVCYWLIFSLIVQSSFDGDVGDDTAASSTFIGCFLMSIDILT